MITVRSGERGMPDLSRPTRPGPLGHAGPGRSRGDDAASAPRSRRVRAYQPRIDYCWRSARKLTHLALAARVRSIGDALTIRLLELQRQLCPDHDSSCLKNTKASREPCPSSCTFAAQRSTSSFL